MFNIKRFTEQFTILVRQNKNRHLLLLAVFVGIQLFGYVNYFTGNSHMEAGGFYTTANIFSAIIGIVACQDVFNRLRSTPSGIQYLMLPATITEKYAAAWLYSSLFALAMVQGTYFVVQTIGIGSGNLITGLGSSYGYPDAVDMLTVLQTALFTHAIFFFGSILFRKNPIIKTLGSYIGISFVVTLLFAWYAKLFLFGTHWTNDSNMVLGPNGVFEGSINGMPLQQLFEFIGVNVKWFMGALSLLLWSGAYLLLKNKQI